MLTVYRHSPAFADDFHWVVFLLSYNQRHDVHSTHHHVVQQSDIDKLKSVFQTSGDVAVTHAALGMARRVIMGDDNGGSIVLQGGLYQFAGMNFCAVQGAGEQRFVRNQAMLVVEEEHGKFFALKYGEMQTQPVTYCLTGSKRCAGFAQLALQQG